MAERNVWGRFWQGRNGTAAEGRPLRKANLRLSAGSLAGARSRPVMPKGTRGRLTQEGGSSAYGALWGMAVNVDREVDWQALDLDARTLGRISTGDLVEMMADLSPEVSGALWHFTRFCNPGWETRVLRPGSEMEDKKGRALLDEFLDRLSERYGAVDVVWNSFFMTAFLRGAFFGELVSDKNGRLPLDLIAVDPHAAEYIRRDDPELGAVWQLGQTVEGEFRPLDVPTVQYVPIDPLPGRPPYGRSLVTPAIFSSLFLLGLLHDLRRVVAQQGYPRLDLEVSLQRLTESMPEDIDDDPEKQREWVQLVISQIAEMFSQLQPDDAYVHTDVVKVNRPVGAVDASSLGAVDALIRSVERMATRGLKTMPLLMGSNEAVSETHANRQWEIHVAGIKALQHLLEQMLGHLLTLALEMQGARVEVEFRFAELRESEMLRDAQTEAAKIDNAMRKYLAGWISQAEAALEVTGHAPDRDRPRVIEIVGGADIVDLSVAEGGVARGREGAWRRELLGEMEAARVALERVMGE